MLFHLGNHRDFGALRVEHSVKYTCRLHPHKLGVERLFDDEIEIEVILQNFFFVLYH